MSPAVHAADVYGDALRARRRDERLLAYTLVASVVVHTALVALAPGFRKPDTEPPRPLEVRIVTPPVPVPIRVEPPPRVEPPRPVARAPAVKPEPRPRPAPAPERKPVLTLPKAAPAAAPAFTLPQAAPEAPQAEAKTVAAAPAPSPAAAAPAATPAPAREVPITPPVHDAAYLNNPKPRYPTVASRRGIEGTVHVRVHVSRDGRPLQVALDRTSGSSLLDNAALDAVRGWKFVPARRGQEPVEQAVTVPIVFKLDNTS